MTKKEMYSEWVAIINSLNALNPEKHTAHMDAGYALDNFDAGKYTKKQLQEMLEKANKAFEVEQENLRKEAWLETEVGQEWQEGIIDAYEAVWEEREEAMDELKHFVQVLILDQLDGNWDVRIEPRSTEIQLMDEKGERIFGHNFTIHYGYSIGLSKEFELDLNYGCMGGFDPFAEPTRVSLVMAIAKVAKSLTNRGTRNAFKAFADKYRATQDKMYDLNKQEKNPPYNA